MNALPHDIITHILNPFCHDVWFHKCVEEYPLATIIEAHPYFNLDNALTLSSQYGHLDLVKYFAKKRGNLLGSCPQHALVCASHEGHLDVVRYLVSKGVDYAYERNRAVMVACMQGHLNLLKYFVSINSSVATAFNLVENTMCSVIVEYLVSKGASAPPVRFEF